MVTIDKHYNNISLKIEELKQAVKNCLLETGYLPDIDIQSKTSYEMNKLGVVRQKVEEPTIRFDGFKKIGVIKSEDNDIRSLKDLKEDLVRR